ncbi:TetR family transcriptional regulator [Paenibacillus selenitireducens]|uniref:TetR family transcriptional regulator n=1 Tax=Paenibacillus selenitireducens TaxID=1324314 RepID=A0A1T2XCT8_9BACL|nr:TetR/AcrR family transcriptional regulator [Paenibacillus selenitireducens]OPA77701.1 TetR family transcriptional regulator [Paenibacillus selenitireducens]
MRGPNVNNASRTKLLETTSRLLQQQGYHATGLNQITKDSGSPKGSLYYYFPGGKEELAAEAVHRSGMLVAERIQSGLSLYDDPVIAIQQFINQVAAQFQDQGIGVQGVPVAAVALETSFISDRIRESCRQAYESWNQIYANKLIQAGYDENRANQLGVVLNAMIEGAYIISITRQDNQPLLDIAAQIPVLLSTKL